METLDRLRDRLNMCMHLVAIVGMENWYSWASFYTSCFL